MRSGCLEIPLAIESQVPSKPKYLPPAGQFAKVKSLILLSLVVEAIIMCMMLFTFQYFHLKFSFETWSCS